MSFETTSLLLNWMELGVLLAILFRLSSTFGLIANTQRELRRAIRSLCEVPAELGSNRTSGKPAIGLVCRSACTRTSAESTISPDHLAHLPL
jgi:hypothetical protein